MTTPQQQVIDNCKAMVVKAKELYGMDLSDVRVSFDLRGRAAGKAGGRGYRLPGSAYYVKFNRDMLGRDAFDHVLNETVPHEYAHVICFMNPALGKDHDGDWARVCLAMGGSGKRTHSEAVVYGKGTTYEYTTDRGHTVRMSDKHHRHVQMGGTLRYKNNKGTVTNVCAYSIVGVQGRTLAAPVVRVPTVAATPVPAIVHPRVLERFVHVQVPVQQPVVAKPTFAAGNSKASIARAIMLAGHTRGESYENVIAAIMLATGHDRQLARATYKANQKKVGIPE